MSDPIEPAALAEALTAAREWLRGLDTIIARASSDQPEGVIRRHLRAALAALDTEHAAREKAERESAIRMRAVDNLRGTLNHNLERADLLTKERDDLRARVAELEAPGECNSIHKLTARVMRLEAAAKAARHYMTHAPHVPIEVYRETIDALDAALTGSQS